MFQFLNNMANIIKIFISPALRVLSRIFIFAFYFLPISKMGGLKRIAVRLHGCNVGRGTLFSPGLFLLRGENINFGQDCNIGIACRFIDICTIDIGNRVLMSHNITIISGSHFSDSLRSPKQGEIIIGNEVWIGASVTIVGPAVIGEGAIIGANSFVSGHVPAGAVFAGSPARMIRTEE